MYELRFKPLRKYRVFRSRCLFTYRRSRFGNEHAGADRCDDNGDRCAGKDHLGAILNEQLQNRGAPEKLFLIEAHAQERLNVTCHV